MAQNKYPTSPDDYLSACKNAAKELGIDWQVLDTIVYLESSRDLRADAGVKSTAKGLFQWTDGTAKGLGFNSSSDLINSLPTHKQQFDLGVKWLKKSFGNRKLSGGEAIGYLYLANFLPINLKYWGQWKKPLIDGQKRILGKDTTPKTYASNSGLDNDKDGIITIGDIRDKMLKKLKSLHPEYYSTINTTNVSTTDTTEKKT